MKTASLMSEDKLLAHIEAAKLEIETALAGINDRWAVHKQLLQVAKLLYDARITIGAGAGIF